MDFLAHQLGLTRSDWQLHGDHVESGRLASTIRSEKAVDLAFTRSESIAADRHARGLRVRLTEIYSLDLVVITGFYFILMVANILLDIKERGIGSNMSTTLPVAIHFTLIDEDVQGHVDDGLAKDCTDIEAICGRNSSEQIKGPVLGLGLALDADEPALHSEGHNTVEEVPRAESTGEHLRVIVNDAYTDQGRENWREDKQSKQEDDWDDFGSSCRLVDNV